VEETRRQLPEINSATVRLILANGIVHRKVKNRGFIQKHRPRFLFANQPRPGYIRQEQLEYCDTTTSHEIIWNAQFAGPVRPA
jgi:hypothetical protein